MEDKYQKAWTVFRNSCLEYEPEHEVESPKIESKEMPLLFNDLLSYDPGQRPFHDAFIAVVDSLT